MTEWAIVRIGRGKGLHLALQYDGGHWAPCCRIGSDPAKITMVERDPKITTLFSPEGQAFFARVTCKACRSGY